MIFYYGVESSSKEDLMSYQYLDCRREGAVEYLALNRAEVRNAFNDGLIMELTDWAEATAKDSSLRVVVLSGRGKVFCAGADLSWMSKTAKYTRSENLRDATTLGKMLHTMDTLPQALIGRVHGAAIAGGIGLTAVCDIVVAADDAVFGFTEVNLGIVPAVISPYVIAKIGPAAARELFITGTRFGAARAGEMGMVQRVVPAGELDAAVDEYIRELSSSAPGAVAAAKHLVRSVFGRPPREVMDVACEILADRRASDEAQAGITAFLEKKRSPWVEQ